MFFRSKTKMNRWRNNMPQSNLMRQQVLTTHGINDLHIWELVNQFTHLQRPKVFIYHAMSPEDTALAYLLQASLEAVHLSVVTRKEVAVDQAWTRDEINEAGVYFLLCSGNLFEEDAELCAFTEIAFRNLRAHDEKRIFPLALDHSVKVDNDSTEPQADHLVVDKLANITKANFTKWKVRNEFLTGLFQIFRAFSTDTQKAYRPNLPKGE